MDQERARRVYRVLLRAYPSRERDRYGHEMEEAFLALLARDSGRGWWGRCTCWCGAGWDAVRHGLAARATRSRDDGRDGGGRLMETFFSDVRFAMRALGRRPLFTATAVLTLALGIGANATIFTVVNGFLFTPLPYHAPEELVTLRAANPERGWNRTDVGPADVWDWRARARTLDDIAVFYGDGLNMTGDGSPELVDGIRTSPNLLDLLGVAPILGRGFVPGEFGPEHQVAILTDGFWERRFARSPDVMGSTLTLDGNAFTVVGILPRDFLFLDSRPDVFLPLTEDPASADRNGHYADALGRLAEGATLAEARTELAGIAAQLADEYPETNLGWTVEVTPTHADLVGDVARRASLVLLTAVAFILLMACVNVANLLLARGEGRSRELAVRAALGAGRARVIRQLLTESLVLAVLGGVLGIASASWGYRVVIAGLPRDVPTVFQWSMDSRVILFSLAVTLGSALVFGLLPAFRAAGHAATDLREGGRGGRSRRSGRMGSTLVVTQTALAMVLLVGGGLLMKSLSAMRNQDFGFDARNVLVVRIAPPRATYPDDDAIRAFWDAVEGAARDIPGVTAVGSTQSHPLMGSNWANTVRIAGRDDVEESVRTTYATPGLFEALRFRVVEGRALTDMDGPDQPPVAVVNETFVRRYLPQDVDPLSQTLLAGAQEPLEVPIVGVIHDVIERSVDRPPEPSMYVSLSQRVVSTRSLVVRTSGDPRDKVNALQQAVWSVDPEIPLYGVETMEAVVRRRLGGFTVIGMLMGTFALISLLLGAVGIYGVTAYAAGRRTGEIGVRLAMGAERGDVVRMVVAQGGVRAVVGLTLGLGLALAMARLLGSVLVGVSAHDPWVFGTVTLVLAAVSYLGLYLPARRASQVDPVTALASE